MKCNKELLKDLEDEITRSSKIGNRQGYKVTWDKLPFWLIWGCSELGEAWESWRDDNEEEVIEELADVFITLFQPIGDLGFTDRFIKKLLWKIDKNSKRGYKHGRKNL